MRFTDTPVVIDSGSKLPAESTGGSKGYTTPSAIATAIPSGGLTIAKVLGLQANLDALAANFANLEIINTKSDLPAPAGGIITLGAGKTYVITSAIDLTGDRLVADGVVNLIGFSSETSSITSTGLGNGIALLTSEYSVVLKDITLKDVHTGLDIDGNSNTVALDWDHVNFSNIPNIGVINTCDNFIMSTAAFLGSQNLRFTGTIGTIGLNNSLFRGIAAAGKILEVDANAIITRRFRVIYSSIIVPSGSTGIHVDASASIPTEGFILDTVNFSGVGTYLAGTTYTSQKALFVNCVGVINTTAIANMYMTNNAVPTDILVAGDKYQVEGTTSTDGQNQKFTHIQARNAMRYESTIPRLFRIQATFSEIGPTNNVIGFYIGVKKGGGTHNPPVDAISESEVYVTSNGTKPDVGMVQCLALLEYLDEIYLIVENSTGTGDVTVSYFNMIIERTN